jgi:hypothetical protein
LDTLTGAIQMLAEPDAVTSHIPVQAADWRAVWGIDTPSRRQRRSGTGEPEPSSNDGDNSNEASNDAEGDA